MRQRDMTEQDLIAASNLQRIWDTKKRSLGLTLEKAGERLGISHSSLSQYITGKMPIGIGFLLKISDLLGVEPRQIRPDFPYRLYPSSDNFSLEAIDLARFYEGLPKDAQRLMYVAFKSAFNSYS